jgi:hypothetical protein
VGYLDQDALMYQLLVTLIFIGLTCTACINTISTPTPGPPTQTATPAPIPPAVQGPAVLGDGVKIEDWEYLGPEAIESFPPLSTTVREVGADIQEVRLGWRPDGFDLVWNQFPCATEPVLVVRADATIEFWSGEIVGPDCEAMAVLHMLTVNWQTSIPFEDWNFILHSPPLPEA